jgi:hypothetical protein
MDRFSWHVNVILMSLDTGAEFVSYAGDNISTTSGIEFHY